MHCTFLKWHNNKAVGLVFVKSNMQQRVTKVKIENLYPSDCFFMRLCTGIPSSLIFVVVGLFIFSTGYRKLFLLLMVVVMQVYEWWWGGWYFW